MYVDAMVTECDFNNKTYNNPVRGAEVLAQGATGRWCAVLVCGPEFLKNKSIIPKSRKEAVNQCMKVLREQNEQRPEPGQYTEEELHQFIDF